MEAGVETVERCCAFLMMDKRTKPTQDLSLDAACSELVSLLFASFVAADRVILLLELPNFGAGIAKTLSVVMVLLCPGVLVITLLLEAMINEALLFPDGTTGRESGSNEILALFSTVVSYEDERGYDKFVEFDHASKRRNLKSEVVTGIFSEKTA